MLRFLCVIISASVFCGCTPSIDTDAHITPFEQSDSNATATYEEGIDWWKALADQSPFVKLQTFGQTDAGLPLHLAIINTSRNFSLKSIHKSEKTIWLINNAIHPGEPDGVDASMLYARHILSQPDFAKTFTNTVILIIPFYNVGGAIHRNCCSRANQNGPEAYGFRGNARNLDLNRDFAKADSKNAQSFLALFNQWDPDVYLETHVSNGADYPYTLTYLTSHPEKLTSPMNNDMNTIFTQPLVEAMSEMKDDIIPYVNVFGTSPDSGYAAFYDSPRYSTGYTALVNSFGLLTETHMLKPFARRVESTLNFLHALGNIINASGEAIIASRSEAHETMMQQEEFVLNHQVDMEQPDSILFSGYQAYSDTSEVTGLPQLYYDRSSSWTKQIPYYSRLEPTSTVSAPDAYLVPASWSKVTDLLRLNGVDMKMIGEDTSITCVSYKISGLKTKTQAYEGHYLHYNTKVEAQTQTIKIRGSSYYMINLNQRRKRFIIEMLEPEAPDSYFNWNFYDEVLQRKEGFSSYVFDREAESMLQNPEHRDALDVFLNEHPELSENAQAQLYFLYKRSDHFERDRFMTYPVYRIE